MSGDSNEQKVLQPIEPEKELSDVQVRDEKLQALNLSVNPQLGDEKLHALNLPNSVKSDVQQLNDEKLQALHLSVVQQPGDEKLRVLDLSVAPQLRDEKLHGLNLPNVKSYLPQEDVKLHGMNLTYKNNVRTNGASELEIEEDTPTREIIDEQEVINNNHVETALLNKETSSSGVKFDNGKPDKLDGIYHQDPTTVKLQLESGKELKAEEEEECIIKCLYFTIQCCDCTLM